MSKNRTPARYWNLEKALYEECEALHGKVPPNVGKPGDDHFISKLSEHLVTLEEPRAALCLSGGGIRSATFSLGVLLELEQHGLLELFHFLSSVSGGGYIASWWVAKRQRQKHAACKSGLTQLLDVESAAQQHLRAYSNYLTPRLGLLSGDTWTLIAIYLRNLTLNWLVIIPVLMGVLAVARIPGALFVIQAPAALMCGFSAVAIAGILRVVGLAFTDRNRPSLPRKDGHLNTRSEFLVWGLIPMILSCFLLCLSWAWISNAIRPQLDYIDLIYFTAAAAVLNVIGWLLFPPRPLRELAAMLFVGAIGGAVVWFLARNIFPSPFADELTARKYVVFAVPMLMISSAILATVFAGLMSYSTTDEDREWWARAGGWVTLAIVGWLALCGAVEYGPLLFAKAPKLMTSIVSAGGVSAVLTVLIGLSSRTPGESSRKRAVQSQTMRILLSLAAPTAIVVIALLLSLLSGNLIGIIQNSAPGRSLGLPHWREDHATTTTHIIAVVIFIFVAVGGGALLATAVNMNKFSLHAMYRNRLVRAYLGATRPNGERQEHPFTGFDPRDNVAMFALRPRRFRPQSIKDAKGMADALFLHSTPLKERIWGEFTEKGRAALLNRAALKESELLDVFVDEFNRLLDRSIALQEGYDENALPEGPKQLMESLIRNEHAPDHAEGQSLLNRVLLELEFEEYLIRDVARPMPILNMALNLVDGKNLAWQQRKAESFTCTPLHCGSPRLGYRDSQDYGAGIMLGTAMTISGAAASPNMGYHSSPAITFVMALFNARLGWWLGNPGPAGEDTCRLQSPRLSLRPMIEEALGLTNDHKPYVYLSDGGHFDNLGLYDMVLRRCRHIVVIDAGHDPKYQFEDLAEAIRKIRVDQGVSITFDPPMKIDGGGSTYAAFGHIHYSDVLKGSEDGLIVYVKPTLCGDVPVDVKNYGVLSAFPHESTTDQWFTETQFESYRALGKHMAQKLCQNMRNPLNASQRSRPTLKDFFEAVHRSLEPGGSRPSQPAVIPRTLPRASGPVSEPLPSRDVSASEDSVVSAATRVEAATQATSVMQNSAKVGTIGGATSVVMPPDIVALPKETNTRDAPSPPEILTQALAHKTGKRRRRRGVTNLKK